MNINENKERGTIIVVGRNNLHLTKLAVKSALAQDMPCNVLLIDNASSDGTLDWARTHDRILRATFTEQKSLSYCWNYGLKMLFRRDKWNNRMASQEHALVINNDVELRPDTYRILLCHGGPFVTCVSVDTPEQVGGPELVDSVGAIYSRARPHPDFSCFLIRRSVWETAGPFDEDYFPAFCEDLDYHIRMHQAAIPAVCIDLPFLHHGSATVKNAGPAERARILKGADKNRERFRTKWGVGVGSPEYYKIFSA